MEIKEATEFIYKKLNNAYCDNCKGSDKNDPAYEKYCDYCHRKSMNWGIDKYTAEEIAEKILGE